MNQNNSSDTPVYESDPIQQSQDPIQQPQQQLTQHVIGQTDTVEQHHSNVPFYPPLFQLPQQAPLPYMQLPYQQQFYNFPFGGNNMTWTSSVTAPHSLQSSPVVRITPSVTVTVTSSFSTLHTSQSRAVDIPITTLHDQYGSSSQQRPLYGMCGYPTGVLPPLPLPPPQVKAYENYVDKLVKCLPMDDTLFIVSLSKHQLLPGNSSNKIKSLSTQADKALYFLDHVIKPALDIEDTSSFDNLLSIMEQCGYPHVKRLACKIRSDIDKGSNIKTGVKEALLMEIGSPSSQSSNTSSSVEDIGYDSIMHTVLPHAMHWKKIGILLDLDSKELEDLEKTYPNYFIRCCNEMMKKWLRSDRDVSQKKLLASIKLATVSSPQINQAHKIINGNQIHCVYNRDGTKVQYFETLNNL